MSLNNADTQRLARQRYLWLALDEAAQLVASADRDELLIKAHAQLSPCRIQRLRARGWTMPRNTVYVGRPTLWGNPYVVGIDGDAAQCVALYETKVITPIIAAHGTEYFAPLRNKHLACWCKPGVPCHADVLLRIANEVR